MIFHFLIHLLHKYFFQSVSLRIHRGWTSIVGANGSGKTTLLKLITGKLKPYSGTISIPSSFYYCDQTAEQPPCGIDLFLRSHESTSYKLRDMLQIKDDWAARWTTLSYGERKRLQIAAALFNNPDVLAIDEPTNHLDVKSREILFNSLKTFKGIGLLVSHDRKFLDGLCRNTIIISNHKIEIRKSNYSTALSEMHNENEFNIRQVKNLNKQINELKKQADVQKRKADMADRDRSKRNIPKGDRDAKGKIDLARLTSKDATAGKLYKKFKNEMDRRSEKIQSIEIKRSFELGIEFDSAKINKHFPVSIASGELQLNNLSRLYTPDLLITAGQKIGIVGENGSGKTTFVNYIVKLLNFPVEELIYIPQEIEVNYTNRLMSQVKSLNRMERGKVMTIISHLNSDPRHVLETENPSPGEVRKLILAIGLSLQPALIIMDEPTNHMDLPSIECLEEALKICECPVLLVSHDEVFLNNIVTDFWKFESEEKNFYLRGEAII